MILTVSSSSGLLSYYVRVQYETDLLCLYYFISGNILVLISIETCRSVQLK